MPLQIIRNDITKVHVDAIVNAAKESLLGGGGVDGAIHRAAGPELLEECRTLHGCKTGDAKITGAYRLPARYVIHTVGPIWNGGAHHEKELLTSCYRRSLEVAVAHQCESIAFPLISSGIYGYPKAEALQVAVNTIAEFLMDHDMDVYIVVFDRKAVRLSEEIFHEIREFIDDHYVEEHRDDREQRRRRMLAEQHGKSEGTFALNSMPFMDMADQPIGSSCGSQERDAETLDEVMTLEEALGMIDESFSQMLLRKIDESGMKDSECYKKANVDRKLFSKIRSDIHYRPSKQTAIAFAIALKLPLEETRELLMKAGYALSHSNKFDIIIEYFIRQGTYDIFEINDALFAFDQPLLGN